MRKWPTASPVTAASAARRWTTVEAPLDLPTAIAALPARGRRRCRLPHLVAVEPDGAGRDVDGRDGALLRGHPRAAPATLLIVSNEVGLGLVPETPLGRAFRDEQGRLNQAVAAAVAEVEFVAAGLPLRLKP